MHRIATKAAIGLAAVTLGLAGAGLRAQAEPQSQPAPLICEAPADLIRLSQNLPRTGALLAHDRPLKIIAFGSSSTGGAGASSPANSYPSRLEVELRARFPKGNITVLNRGVNGEDAKEMLARLSTSIVDEKPDLVVWQVGTNAVLNDLKLPGQIELIRTGIARIKATGAELVLMDSQYAPRVVAKPDAPRMIQFLDTVGAETRVGVFHRFAIMRHWRMTLNMAFKDFVSDDGLHMNDWSYGCTAKLLAGALVDAATRPVPTISTLPLSHEPHG